MNIKRAKEEIKDSIQAYLTRDAFGEYEIPTIRQRPILLLGAPGIGKTQIMEQIARELKIGLVAYTITHHTRQSAIGLPFIAKRSYGGVERAVTEYTMSEIVAAIYDKMEKTGLREGILFIDEINCVSETLAPAMLQFLQCKTFGSHAIPKGWIIVAAGNPPEYNKSVREFDVVTLDRVKKIQVEPDFQVWKEYAYQEQIHPAVISYLSIRPRFFYQMEQTVEGRQFVTPRGWEDLSRLLYVYERLGKKADREVVVQYLQHPKAAKDFANYLELYEKYQMDYELEAVFQGKMGEGILKKASHAAFDERLSLVSLLVDRFGQACKRVQEEELYLTGLQEKLKEAKGLLEPGISEREKTCQSPETEAGKESALPGREAEGESCGGAKILGKLARMIAEQRERSREAGIISRREDYALRRVQETLEEYGRRFRAQETGAGQEAFAQLREWFAEDRKLYEQLYGQAGETLERAFDFLEVAFGPGQEITVFLTELHTGRDCVDFLQHFSCQRYEQYNRELLPEAGHAELSRRIEQLSGLSL